MYLLGVGVWLGALVSVPLWAVTIFSSEAGLTREAAGRINQAIFQKVDFLQMLCLGTVVLLGPVVWWTGERGLRRLFCGLLGLGLIFTTNTQVSASQRMVELRPVVSTQPVDAPIPQRAEFDVLHARASGLMRATVLLLALLIVMYATRLVLPAQPAGPHKVRLDRQGGAPPETGAGP